MQCNISMRSHFGRSQLHVFRFYLVLMMHNYWIIYCWMHNIIWDLHFQMILAAIREIPLKTGTATMVTAAMVTMVTARTTVQITMTSVCIQGNVNYDSAMMPLLKHIWFRHSTTTNQRIHSSSICRSDDR